ncbi:MAG: hypothetical protein HF978_03905 [Desulfobacteraceae bacterium]|nr:hypothetical protein [Desulfobacteraceae bacterium]MBC2754672.1 hypothetical protein [Desulfobacteraceae bacterium]
MQIRNFKNSFCLVMFLIIFVSLLMVSGCNSSDSDNDKDQNQDHNAMLQALGVDTDIEERKNPVGDPVPVDYNPFLKKNTQLRKLSEIFIAGTHGRGITSSWTNGNQWLHAALDWDGADFKPDNMSGNDGWLNQRKAMASGDVDGDGIDEILLATLRNSTVNGYELELALWVIKRNHHGAYEIVAVKTVEPYMTWDSINRHYDSAYDSMNGFSVVCGDVDNNGHCETLIAFYESIFLMGDSLKGYDFQESIHFSSGDTSPIFLKISAGDLDNNGTDEFVVVENKYTEDVHYRTATYHIYRGLTLDEFHSGNICVRANHPGCELNSSNCAVGDLDADGLNEILFIGLGHKINLGNGNHYDYQYYMFVLEQEWNENLGEFEFNLIKPDHTPIDYRNPLCGTPICAIADFDGDGQKDVIGYRSMYENLSQTGGAFEKKQDVTDLYSPKNANASGSFKECSLAVGDFDGDLKADICYITDDFYQLYCLGFNPAGEWVRKGTGDIMDAGYAYPYVTMGDFDGDSLVVEFIGSEILFSDPHPIVILAANPFWKDVDMDGRTSFGTSTGEQEESENTVGMTVGFSIGCDAKFFSAKTSFEAAFDYTAIHSRTVEQTYTYNTVNEDKVIFTTIPFDVYYYDVIQAPDPDMIGEKITVNLPRKPIKLAVERGFYNENNGEAPDIDDTVLTHRIGNPLSYPTQSQAKQLVNATSDVGSIMMSEMEPVCQRSDYHSTVIREMSIKEASGSQFAFDFSVKFEAEAGLVVNIGGSYGFHYGHSYKVTTSEGTVYTGEVGCIPTAFWDIDHIFRWGLFSYAATLGNERFIVVQYYTDKGVGELPEDNL